MVSSGWAARLLACALAVQVGFSVRAGAPPLPPAGPVGPPAAPAPPLSSAGDSVLDLFNTGETQTIDLAAALRLAGISNPQILIARQRVLETVALRQYAAAQILPTLQIGTSYDQHIGPLQQSTGNILTVSRSSLYVGAGASAVAAGTVSIPGVVWNLNVSDTIFTILMRRQLVEQARLASRATENEMLGRVAHAYLELLRAEGERSVAALVRNDARQVVNLTGTYAKAGVGRKADLDRAETEFARAEANLREAEGRVLIASAQLAALLNLDPSVRLHPVEATVVPEPCVPDPIPLPELLTIAIMNRPELGERQAAIREALLGLRAAKVLPFSPNVLIGLSAGGEGGGSNLVNTPAGTPIVPNFGTLSPGDPRFGKFSGRLDFDVVAFWSLQNLGVGNAAMIKAARSRLNTTNLELLDVLNRVRSEVANAYARSHARFARIVTTETATKTSQTAFEEDATRIKGMVAGVPGRAVRPIELLDSLRLLGDSRYEYLRAIVDYNLAQVDLYVALGQPPADVLARPVPTNFEVPKPAEKKK
jgi:outer membrane protein TolC